MLILARHGQSAANEAGLLQGRVDSPLTELGAGQADAIGRYLARSLAGDRHGAGGPVARVVSSPLERAFQTALRIRDALLTGASEAGSGWELPPVDVDERLIELDYGALDGLRVRDVDPHLWREWQADSGWRPPGGETLEELAARVAPAADSLLAEAKALVDGTDIVAVTHVSPIKAIIASVLGVGVGISWRMSLSVASLSYIGTGLAGPSLVGFNHTSHLVDP